MSTRHHHSRGLGVTSGGTRTRLIDELRAQGIKDSRVLAAMDKVPRHEFVEEALRYRAYENTALPIGLAQTISQPYVVALMTEALMQPAPPKRVLEIGTGSGYQTAVLAELVSSVFSVERLKPLSEKARKRLAALGYHNIIYSYGDGMLGLPAYAPYDAIIVTAGATTLPQTLVDQLAEGGRMVIPLGEGGMQSLLLLEKQIGGRVQRRHLAAVSFVPLLSGKN